MNKSRALAGNCTQWKKKLNSPPLKPVKVDTVCFDHSITLFWTFFVFFPPLLTCLTGQQQGKNSKTGKLITGSTVALSPSSLLRQWATAGTDDKTWTPHRHGEIKVAGFLFLNYWTLALLLLAAHLSLSLSLCIYFYTVCAHKGVSYKMARTDGKTQKTNLSLKKIKDMKRLMSHHAKQCSGIIVGFFY